MIVFVTGASGLVGRHVVDKLSSENGVVVIAQFQSEPLPSWNKNNILLLKTDFNNKHLCEFFDKFAPDIIVHCAAKIPTYSVSSKQAAAVNKLIDAAISSIALKYNAPVIYISSVIVYENAHKPYQENMLLQPITPYAVQKYKSELLFSNLNTYSVSLRISSPYGGYQEPDRNVLYKFIHCALSDGDLKVHGTGTRCQNFIYGMDIADAVWNAAMAWSSKLEVGGVYNIASDQSTSMKDLANLIVHIAGKGNVVMTGENNADDLNNPIIDINKSYEKLSWQPRTSITVGISNIIDEIRSLRC